MPFQTISFGIEERIQCPHKLILSQVPKINEALKRNQVSAYVIYIASHKVTIRVIKSEGTCKVSKLYYVRKKEGELLYGSGFSIYYNNSLYAEETFSWEWAKKVGLFTTRKKKDEGRRDYFPSNGKELTITLVKNHRRLWSNE